MLKPIYVIQSPCYSVITVCWNSLLHFRIPFLNFKFLDLPFYSEMGRCARVPLPCTGGLCVYKDSPNDTSEDWRAIPSSLTNGSDPGSLSPVALL